METKRCCHCKQEKLISKFWKDSRTKDGLQSKCIQCCKENYRYPKGYIEVQCKKCSKCKIEKDASEFFYSSKSKTHLSSWCKDCEKEKHVKRYAKNPEQQKQYDTQYTLNNLDKVKN